MDTAAVYLFQLAVGNMIVRESTAGINVDTVENLCWNSFKCSAFIFNNISIFLVTLVYLSSFSGIRKKCWWHFNRRDYVWLTLCLFICCAVMNNPELPLDPNLQTSNLLITFLKYASIVMQDTKGKEQPSCPLPLCLCHSTFLCVLILSLLFLHNSPEVSTAVTNIFFSLQSS